VAIRTLILTAILVLAGAYAHDLDAKRAVSAGLPDLQSLPASFGEWQSEDYPLTPSVARVLGADVTLQRRYWTPGGHDVLLFLAYFSKQAVNSQIHSPRHCVPGSGWDIVSMEDASVHPGERSQPATRMLLSHDERPYEMLYWFRTRGGVVTGEYSLKWDLVLNSLRRRPTDAVFVRYSAALEDTARMAKVMTRLEPDLDRVLNAVGIP
jgi:EpsI family protein